MDSKGETLFDETCSFGGEKEKKTEMDPRE